MPDFSIFHVQFDFFILSFWRDRMRHLEKKGTMKRNKSSRKQKRPGSVKTQDLLSDGAGFGTRSGMVWTAMSNAFAVHVFLTNLEATEPSSGSAHDTGWAPAARASVDAAMISTMPAFMIGARASLLGGVDGREMRPRVATLGRNDHDRSRERQSVDVRRRRRVLRPGRRRWRLSTSDRRPQATRR